MSQAKWKIFKKTFPLLGASFFMSSLRAAPNIPRLPAAEILESIQILEKQEITAFEDAEYKIRLQHASQIQVDWEPEAMPQALRSWMQLQLNEETMQELKHNRNMRGDILL